VTDRLDIALFFALMKFQKPASSYEGIYTPRDATSRMPGLYILFPSENQQFDYERYRTKGFPPGRPDAQSAYFIHIGWGHADNLCASRIFLALYLDPKGDFGSIPSPRALFPPNDVDPFAAFLTNIRQQDFAGQIGSIVSEGFYTIAHNADSAGDGSGA
jgi:hypothetical protein